MDQVHKFIESGVRGGFVLVGSSTPKDAVRAEVRRLGLVVPEAYVDFLSRYGWLDYDVHFLGGVEAGGSDGLNLELINDRVAREAWPDTDGFIFFGFSGINPLGFSGSGSVWVWDHDFGIGETAPDFNSFLRDDVLRV